MRKAAGLAPIARDAPQQTSQDLVRNLEADELPGRAGEPKPKPEPVLGRFLGRKRDRDVAEAVQLGSRIDLPRRSERPEAQEPADLDGGQLVRLACRLRRRSLGRRFLG